MTPANGLYYKVLKDEFSLDCVKPQPTTSMFSKFIQLISGWNFIKMMPGVVWKEDNTIYCIQWMNHNPVGSVVCFVYWILGPGCLTADISLLQYANACLLLEWSYLSTQSMPPKEMGRASLFKSKNILTFVLVFVLQSGSVKPPRLPLEHQLCQW